MIKKLLAVLFMLGVCVSIAKAEKAKIQGIESGEVVSVSSYTWTAVPSTTTVNISRIGLLLDTTSQSETFKIIYSTVSVSVPTNSSADGFTLLGTDDIMDIPISGYVYLYMMNLSGATSRNVWVAEYQAERY